MTEDVSRGCKLGGMKNSLPNGAAIWSRRRGAVCPSGGRLADLFWQRGRADGWIAGMSEPVSVEQAVRSRYSTAAREKVEALCCPVDYNRELLRVIPAEVLERDYGCGDPSRHVRPGEVVLDLGCGGGKICFIASQVVGPRGRVIGVDMNDEMLALARRHQRGVGEAIGWQNVEFRKGRIQDLALDLERFDAVLRGRNLAGVEGWLEAEALAGELRERHPLVAGESVDVVVSNCVLNLVEPGAKGRLFGEIYRVLRQGGRAVISDIVSDRAVPEAMRRDGELWSGCIAGALTEEEFAGGFAGAGFASVRVLKREAEPWRVVEGIEFRSVTVEAGKGSVATTAGTCCEPGKCC